MIRATFITVLVALVAAPMALAHKGNPNYLSEIKGITPPIEGVRLEMINRDDRVLLDNRSGKDVVVMGYDDGEQYARIKADGTVEVNTNSKAYYLNEDRFATSKVPDSLPSTPKWQHVSGSHRFEWHDHRSHYMGKGRPAKVTNPDEKTKIFDWDIPLQADGQPAKVTGTLYWTPLPSDTPTGAIIAGVVICVASLITVVVVRRRRSRAGSPQGAREVEEAW